jgi:hypothetical protein
LTGILCRHGKQNWNGSPPYCAFNLDGTFRDDNWNCFLINKLRRFCNQHEDNYSPYGTYWYDNDDCAGVIYVPFGDFIGEEREPNPLAGSIVILNWYKSRGCTDSFRIVQNMAVRNGTEKDVRILLKYFAFLKRKGEKMRSHHNI